MPTIDQLTITPATALYSNLLNDSAISASVSSLEGRKAIVLDFNQGDGVYARDLGAILRFPIGSGTILYTFQPTVIPQPENTYNRATDWTDAGSPGAKWVQGCLIEANSFGAGKTFQLQSSDDLSLHPLVEISQGGVIFNKQSVKAFSCVPFVAHMARLVASDGVKCQVFNWAPVFQPYPELTQNWTTEMSSLGSVGWNHLRELNIAHVSTADLTLVLRFDQWPTVTITIPHSNGAHLKTLVTMPPNKWKLVGFSLTSTQPFRVFLADMEVKCGMWGRSDGYRIQKPFGGNSSPGAEV